MFSWWTLLDCQVDLEKKKKEIQFACQSELRCRLFNRYSQFLNSFTEDDLFKITEMTI